MISPQSHCALAASWSFDSPGLCFNKKQYGTTISISACRMVRLKDGKIEESHPEIKNYT